MTGRPFYVLACAAGRTGRTLTTIRLSPSNIGSSGKYPNATLTVRAARLAVLGAPAPTAARCLSEASHRMLVHLQAGLPSGCVPYSVKNSNSDQKKCPQACELSGFDSDTDADKRARPSPALLLPPDSGRVQHCGTPNPCSDDGGDFMNGPYKLRVTATPERAYPARM